MRMAMAWKVKRNINMLTDMCHPPAKDNFHDEMEAV
jgi:hypothetical protein